MRIERGALVLDADEITVRPDIFVPVEGDEMPHLCARRCADCGDVSFPPYRHCLKCGSEKETEEKVLSNHGVLASFTVARQVMPGFNPGYILANVRMKDDPTLVLVAQLTDVKKYQIMIIIYLILEIFSEMIW